MDDELRMGRNKMIPVKIVKLPNGNLFVKEVNKPVRINLKNDPKEVEKSIETFTVMKKSDQKWFVTACYLFPKSFLRYRTEVNVNLNSRKIYHSENYYSTTKMVPLRWLEIAILKINK